MGILHPSFVDQEILQNMKVYKNIRQMNPCILLMELSSIATLITVKISTYAGLRLTTRCIMYIFLNLPSIITCKWSLSWYQPTGKRKKHTNLFLFIITDRSKLLNNYMQYGTEHSHKVPRSTGSRNGVEGRGSSLYKIVVRRGYNSMKR